MLQFLHLFFMSQMSRPPISRTTLDGFIKLKHSNIPKPMQNIAKNTTGTWRETTTPPPNYMLCPLLKGDQTWGKEPDFKRFPEGREDGAHQGFQGKDAPRDKGSDREGHLLGPMRWHCLMDETQSKRAWLEQMGWADIMGDRQPSNI